MPEDLPDNQIYEERKDCARTTVLHEFGHALGLHHEHASPKALFVWSAERLGNHNYAPVIGSAGDKVNVSAFDISSIMLLSAGREGCGLEKDQGWHERARVAQVQEGLADLAH